MRQGELADGLAGATSLRPQERVPGARVLSVRDVPRETPLVAMHAAERALNFLRHSSGRSILVVPGEIERSGIIVLAV
jgi:hypothetical protein